MENAIDLDYAKQVRKVVIPKLNEIVETINSLEDKLDAVKAKIRKSTKKMTLDVDDEDEDEAEAEEL